MADVNRGCIVRFVNNLQLLVNVQLIHLRKNQKKQSPSYCAGWPCEWEGEMEYDADPYDKDDQNHQGVHSSQQKTYSTDVNAFCIYEWCKHFPPDLLNSLPDLPTCHNHGWGIVIIICIIMIFIIGIIIMSTFISG